jgi:predicted DNA binding CopG/RHH family protein
MPGGKSITLDLSQEVIDRFKARAARNGVSFQKYMRNLLDDIADSPESSNSSERPRV